MPLEDQNDENERAALDVVERWLELRDLAGRLYGRYNPVADVIEIRRQGHTETFELPRYREQQIWG